MLGGNLGSLLFGNVSVMPSNNAIEVSEQVRLKSACSTHLIILSKLQYRKYLTCYTLFVGYDKLATMLQNTDFDRNNCKYLYRRPRDCNNEQIQPIIRTKQSSPENRLLKFSKLLTSCLTAVKSRAMRYK